MAFKKICYVKINRDERNVVTYGFTANEFFKSLGITPEYLLVLNGYSDACIIDDCTYLQYAEKSDVFKVIEEGENKPNPFCFVNFKSLDKLKNIPKSEQEKLLNLGKNLTVKDNFIFSDLQNDYVYIKKKDNFSYFYMEHIENFYKAIKDKIISELKGRKKSMAEMPEDILENLCELFERGATLDLSNAYSTGVKIYVTGKFRNLSFLKSRMEKEKIFLRCVHINYDRALKSWKVF